VMATSQQIEHLFRTSIMCIRTDTKEFTEIDIEKCVEEMSSLSLFATYGFSSEEKARVAVRIKRSEGITMKIGSLIEDNTTIFKEWLPNKKLEAKDDYWNAYRSLLAEKNGFSSQVLYALDLQTDKILAKCTDPNSNEWACRKGMVVGSVQSGKTANYIGLITKAADFGYKVIIVVAGIPEDLRSQTQRRINEGFVGQDASAMATEGIRRTGVGVTRDPDIVTPWSFTQEKFDFSALSANRAPITLTSELPTPVVFVVKKNNRILGNLLQWLSSSSALDASGKIDLPLLFIDDEADNASVNTKYKQDALTKINDRIRSILDRFSKSTYIGYTATPFANIFIDPDSQDRMGRQDQFPRHFIVGLEPPSNYIGPNSIFLREAESCHDILIEVKDYHDCIPLKHKTDLEPILPPTLVDAIHCFLISDAIKHLRDSFNSNDSSMLINVSYLKDIHEKLKLLVHEELLSIKSAVRSYCAMPNAESQSSAIRRLKSVYMQCYPRLSYTFDMIKKALLHTANRSEVITVNSSKSSTESLTYGDSLKRSYIVIGGYSLSRGLTLDGLTVSYFLRSTAMYDTLLQMGRWFGYRPGYEDICRIWMTREATEWYAHISIADSELRQDLAALQRIRLSPLDFGLRVRSHPDALLITAKNKMGSSEELKQEILLAGKFVETIDIEADTNVITGNHSHCIKFVGKILSVIDHGPPELCSHYGMYGHLFRGIDSSLIVSFIQSFNSLSVLTRNPQPISQHIFKRSDDELTSWDVFIPSPRENKKKVNISENLAINLQLRTATLKSYKEIREGSYLSLSSRGKVAGRGIERIGLSESEVKQIENEWLSENKAKSIKNIPDSVFRTPGRKPLLALHFLDIGESDSLPLDLVSINVPVTAWSISFPPTTKTQSSVEYRVNTSWIKSLDLSSEIEENDGDLDPDQ